MVIKKKKKKSSWCTFSNEKSWDGRSEQLSRRQHYPMIDNVDVSSWIALHNKRVRKAG
jgi:hypothetical protein